ncbi:MAG: SpoIIE family protein phosphatase [Verrucomicrobiota bacterium]
MRSGSVNERQPENGEIAPHLLSAALLHDLRTPLNHIIGYTEMLMEEAQEQGQIGFMADLEKTHAAGKQLLALIDDNFCPLRPAGETTSIAEPPEAHSTPIEEDAVEERRSVFPIEREAAAVGPGRLLVVDDIEANRDVLSRRLRRQGYAVATAENGREAMERLRVETFDLVLLDIMMPEMDGYEVLQRLKADDALRSIPVIMISALGQLDSVVRCIEMGAEDYLLKPFNPTLLKARIGACLEKKRAHDRATFLFAQLEENHQRMQELAGTLQTQNTEMALWRAVQDADLAVARTTQQAIVNSALPQLDGWQMESIYAPLIQVGGDVYGWRQLDSGAWLFWLADATGHGVAAALFTTFVALLFHHASAESGTASEILGRVNDEFYSVIRKRAFMTACCAVIDAEGRLTYAGAGHPPLLIRRGDAPVEALPSLNTMMGIEPAMKVVETVTTLASGDVALLYTDGIYSLKSECGKRFTMENVTAAFARNGGSANLLPQMIANLIEQSDTQAFDDDVAAIALRRS